MSLLDSLVNGLFGGNTEENTAAKPCANCPGDCKLFPNACEECSPYKTKLTDQLYFVDHLDAYYDRYEIAGTTVETVPVGECPGCGAPNPGGNVCQYCGTVIREDSGKIRVSGASEIPDPIQQAQETIFARQELVKRYSGQESTGLLNTILDILSGDDDNDLGSRMTTDQIKNVAAKYGVSVSAYLQGLDNGTYLTAAGKERADRAAREQAAQTSQATAAGMFTGAAMGGNNWSHQAPQPPRPNQGYQNPFGQQQMPPHMQHNHASQNSGPKPGMNGTHSQFSESKPGHAAPSGRDDRIELHSGHPGQQGRPTGFGGNAQNKPTFGGRPDNISQSKPTMGSKPDANSSRPGKDNLQKLKSDHGSGKGPGRPGR